MVGTRWRTHPRNPVACEVEHALQRAASPLLTTRLDAGKPRWRQEQETVPAGNVSGATNLGSGSPLFPTICGEVCRKWRRGTQERESPAAAGLNREVPPCGRRTKNAALPAREMRCKVAAQGPCKLLSGNGGTDECAPPQAPLLSSDLHRGLWKMSTRHARAGVSGCCRVEQGSAPVRAADEERGPPAPPNEV